MHDSILYKILTRPEFETFKSDGVFSGAGIDLGDGFIHLSSASQVGGTVEKYFKNRLDVMLLAVDTANFGESLRWEPSRGGELFPHLYRPLPYEAVLAVSPVEYLADGRLKLPR